MQCFTVELAREEKMKLESGEEIGPFTVAYTTDGTLNEDRSNAIMICHALTGDQYVRGRHPVTDGPGWWEKMVGPGKPLDTDRYYIVCANVLGGCMGSTGPRETNPETGTRWARSFPIITINDMVRAQVLLLDHLGIDTLLCVIGGSMGAMQTLAWAILYPDRVFSAVPIAGAARHSAQNIAFHEVGRRAIMADPDWREGAYLDHEVTPERGLAVARMMAHITYLSEASLHRKFGRELQKGDAFSFAFEPDFKVESYLEYQGQKFVERFDANSYLYITRAMDYFDLAARHDGNLTQAFTGTQVRFCLVSFTSDWLFPTPESREIVRALKAVAANVSFVEIETDKGHDAFLLDEPEFHDTISGFVNGVAEHRGLDTRNPPGVPIRNMPMRSDLDIIAGIIQPGSRVLDIGCDDGTLLHHLTHHKGVKGRGMELSQSGVNACVARGLSVIQGDADVDLADYPDDAFDYVVLSRTLQATRSPRDVLSHLVRIGRHAVVSFTNIGHWRVRLGLFLQGRMPAAGNGGYDWYDSPNIRLCTIRDFAELCDELDLRVEQALSLSRSGEARKLGAAGAKANLRGEEAIFLLSRR